MSTKLLECIGLDYIIEEGKPLALFFETRDGPVGINPHDPSGKTMFYVSQISERQDAAPHPPSFHCRMDEKGNILNIEHMSNTS